MSAEQSRGGGDHDRPWQDKERLREALEAAETQAEAADRLGCSRPTIQRWSARHGLEFDGAAWGMYSSVATADVREAIEAVAEETHYFKSRRVADKLDVDVATAGCLLGSRKDVLPIEVWSGGGRKTTWRYTGDDDDLETDGGTAGARELVEACPACDSSQIRKRVSVGDWCCYDCDATFDAPVERARKQAGGPAGYCDAIEQVIDETGSQYFTADELARHFDRTAKTIGGLLARRELPVEAWGTNGTRTTWRYTGNDDIDRELRTDGGRAGDDELYVVDGTDGTVVDGAFDTFDDALEAFREATSDEGELDVEPESVVISNRSRLERLEDNGAELSWEVTD